jgi:polyisoprenoid-binding protein YceI
MCKLASLLLALPLAAAAADTYSIDPVHSFPHFELSHLGMSTMRGHFEKMSGTITLDLAAKTGALEVSIDTASITTGDARHEPGSFAATTFGPRSRDEVLRSALFFGVAEFPAMTYRSTQFNFKGDVLDSIDGHLTLHGVTRPVRLTVTRFKCAAHPLFKKDMCGADATAKLKRAEFGMDKFVAVDGDEVTVLVSVEAYKN